MKRFALAAVAVTLVACTQKIDDKKGAAGQVPAKAPGMVFKDSGEKALYSVATRLGEQMRGTLDGIKKMGVEGYSVEANNAIIVKGFSDALNGKPGLTPAEAQAAVEEFGKVLQVKMEAKASQDSAGNKAKGVAFIAQFDQQAGVKKTASGLRYKVLTEGDKKSRPSVADTVVVHYSGKLIDGTEFDSSYTRNEPATFGVGQVIPGWTEALQLMSKGDKWQLVIPSELAYADRATGGPIPPGSTLVFEVQLVDIVKSANRANPKVSK